MLAFDASSSLNDGLTLPTYDFLPDPNDPLGRTREEIRRISQLSKEDFDDYMRGVAEPTIVGIRPLGGSVLGPLARENLGGVPELGIILGGIGDILDFVSSATPPGSIVTYSDGTEVAYLNQPSNFVMALQAIPSFVGKTRLFGKPMTGAGAEAVKNIGRIDHAGKNLARLIPGNQGSKAFREALRSHIIRIIDNPSGTFNHVLTDGFKVKGYLGKINGEEVVFFVAKETKGKISIGELVGGWIPSPTQLTEWGF